ncbi:TIGR02391 family protein [Paenibacillus soyae]|uniref:TIGR02391 family protein n=1 Tax=Paenibacillus soyae TaxID=2969249 RepID=A0A9X2MSB9_9BACL|nr:TIGR02391 family protein [Paenibacillus soyae]MCR2805944.1 TIGR02391 family protein [Paenibacillus soyae]
MFPSKLAKLRIQKVSSNYSSAGYLERNRIIEEMNGRGLLHSGMTFSRLSDLVTKQANDGALESLVILKDDILSQPSERQINIKKLDSIIIEVYDNLITSGNSMLNEMLSRLGSEGLNQTHEIRVNAGRKNLRSEVELVQEEIRSMSTDIAEEQNKPRSPLTIDNLHENVMRVSKDYYKDGHYRAAVLDTYIDLINRVKVISGRTDIDGSPLMQQVFSPKNPQLLVSDDSDEQQGFMWLFSGAVMAIRNPKAHRIVEITDPQRTLEWLGFASVLHRVLDDIENVGNS